MADAKTMVECPHCHKKTGLLQELELILNRSLKCPQCQNSFTVNASNTRVHTPAPPPQPPKPSPQAWLVVLAGRNAIGVHALMPGVQTIGRKKGAAAQIALETSDASVSGVHCQISVAAVQQGQPPSLVLQDLGSKNGTWLNGLRKLHAQDSFYLAHGDCLQLGFTQVRVLLAQPEETPTTAQTRALRLPAPPELKYT